MKTLTDKLQYLYGQVNAAHREYIAEAMVEIERLTEIENQINTLKVIAAVQAHSEPIGWRAIFADGSKGKHLYTQFPIPKTFNAVELIYERESDGSGRERAIKNLLTNLLIDVRR